MPFDHVVSVYCPPHGAHGDEAGFVVSDAVDEPWDAVE